MRICVKSYYGVNIQSHFVFESADYPSSFAASANSNNLLYPSSDAYLQDLYENQQHYLLDDVYTGPVLINPNVLAYLVPPGNVNNDVALQKYWGKLYHDFTKFNQPLRTTPKIMPFQKRTIPIEFQKQLYAHGVVGRRR
ncbi:unnamed protein product [Didymodactylos carnosus]|uniref:Uncharacterized protein n=1 Tax=Didymodactylos carnosus TaxID=1234261 RepID=A0A815V8T9_9BILA|nr:unnamed protein product [Didymodactylos carnosus]CAF1527349.1 unnamed protein product [Didymodactylos carnosus]CAF4241660.1 unnamed protein product [Didymodactylos carnosus]CAF4386475.1 unnamed protein product [Didymodactylos carnosus]